MLSSMDVLGWTQLIITVIVTLIGVPVAFFRLWLWTRLKLKEHDMDIAANKKKNVELDEKINFAIADMKQCRNESDKKFADLLQKIDEKFEVHTDRIIKILSELKK